MDVTTFTLVMTAYISKLSKVLNQSSIEVLFGSNEPPYIHVRTSKHEVSSKLAFMPEIDMITGVGKPLLDLSEEEVSSAGSPLLALDHVIFSPHQRGETRESFQNHSGTVARWYARLDLRSVQFGHRKGNGSTTLA